MEYDSDDDVRKSFEAAYEAIRERIRNGGPGWTPKPWTGSRLKPTEFLQGFLAKATSVPDESLKKDTA